MVTLLLETTLPHSHFGDPDCCGCLQAIEGAVAGQADLICNECLTVVRSVPVADLEYVVDEMDDDFGRSYKSLL